MFNFKGLIKYSLRSFTVGIYIFTWLFQIHNRYKYGFGFSEITKGESLPAIENTVSCIETKQNVNSLQNKKEALLVFHCYESAS
jgi:hypothetical protein